MLFYFSPQRTDFIFLCRRAEAADAPLLCKAPSSVLSRKRAFIKVSGLDGFWASKSQSLFSTHRFYRIGWKSDKQIVQREKQRGRATASPVQASLHGTSLPSIIRPLICELQSFMLQTELERKGGVCPYGTPEQCRNGLFNEHRYLILMLNLEACKSTLPPLVNL